MWPRPAAATGGSHGCRRDGLQLSQHELRLLAWCPRSLCRQCLNGDTKWLWLHWPCHVRVPARRLLYWSLRPGGIRCQCLDYPAPPPRCTRPTALAGTTVLTVSCWMGLKPVETHMRLVTQGSGRLCMSTGRSSCPVGCSRFLHAHKSKGMLVSTSSRRPSSLGSGGVGRL